jgi:hypothetical protein
VHDLIVVSGIGYVIEQKQSKKAVNLKKANLYTSINAHSKNGEKRQSVFTCSLLQRPTVL